MKKETYYCDECGAERKEANHWWTAFITDCKNGVVLYPFSAETFPDPVIHLCGQKCVHAALDRFMSTGQLTK